MSDQQKGVETEIYFSGEIRDGKIYGLTATDGNGVEYEITISLRSLGTAQARCYVCSRKRPGHKPGDVAVEPVTCTEVDCPPPQ